MTKTYVCWTCIVAKESNTAPCPVCGSTEPGFEFDDETPIATNPTADPRASAPGESRQTRNTRGTSRTQDVSQGQSLRHGRSESSSGSTAQQQPHSLAGVPLAKETVQRPQRPLFGKNTPVTSTAATVELPIRPGSGVPPPKAKSQRSNRPPPPPAAPAAAPPAPPKEYPATTGSVPSTVHRNVADLSEREYPELPPGHPARFDVPSEPARDPGIPVMPKVRCTENNPSIWPYDCTPMKIRPLGVMREKVFPHCQCQVPNCRRPHPTVMHDIAYLFREVWVEKHTIIPPPPKGQPKPLLICTKCPKRASAPGKPPKVHKHSTQDHSFGEWRDDQQTADAFRKYDAASAFIDFERPWYDFRPGFSPFPRFYYAPELFPHTRDRRFPTLAEVDPQPHLPPLEKLDAGLWQSAYRHRLDPKKFDGLKESLQDAIRATRGRLANAEAGLGPNFKPGIGQQQPQSTQPQPTKPAEPQVASTNPKNVKQWTKEVAKAVEVEPTKPPPSFGTVPTAESSVTGETPKEDGKADPFNTGGRKDFGPGDEAVARTLEMAENLKESSSDKEAKFFSSLNADKNLHSPKWYPGSPKIMNDKFIMEMRPILLPADDAEQSRLTMLIKPGSEASQVENNKAIAQELWSVFAPYVPHWNFKSKTTAKFADLPKDVQNQLKARSANRKKEVRKESVVAPTTTPAIKGSQKPAVAPTIESAADQSQKPRVVPTTSLATEESQEPIVEQYQESVGEEEFILPYDFAGLSEHCGFIRRIKTLVEFEWSANSESSYFPSLKAEFHPQVIPTSKIAASSHLRRWKAFTRVHTDNEDVFEMWKDFMERITEEILDEVSFVSTDDKTRMTWFKKIESILSMQFLAVEDLCADFDRIAGLRSREFSVPKVREVRTEVLSCFDGYYGSITRGVTMLFDDDAQGLGDILRAYSNNSDGVSGWDIIRGHYYPAETLDRAVLPRIAWPRRFEAYRAERLNKDRPWSLDIEVDEDETDDEPAPKPPKKVVSSKQKLSRLPIMAPAVEEDNDVESTLLSTGESGCPLYQHPSVDSEE